MGKNDSEFFVDKLVGVKEEQGKLKFFVKWRHFPSSDNSWEPLENLGKIKGMVNEYLLEHGYKPLTETNRLERVVGYVEEPSFSDAEEPETAGKSMTKKKEGKKANAKEGKTGNKKEKKTIPQTLKLPASALSPEVKKQLTFHTPSPTQAIQKPDPVRKVEKPHSSVPVVSSTTSQNSLAKEVAKAQPSQTQNLPAKRRADDTSEPTPSKSHKKGSDSTTAQTAVSSGKKAVLFSEKTRPEVSSSPAFPADQKPVAQDTDSKPSSRGVSGSEDTPVLHSKDSNSTTNNLFQGFSVRPGSLEYDRPVKILGCREGKSGLEYSIMFAPDTKPFPLFKIVSHQELLSKAPWLFARFFIDNHSLPQ